jgi:hypothetical protein
LVVARPLMVVWVVVWWLFAVKSWRLSRPGEVYGVLGVIGGLCVLITMALQSW